MARPASGRPRPADFLDSRPQLNPRGLVLPAHPGPHGSPGPGLRPCCPHPALGRALALGTFTPCQPPGGNEQSQRGRVPDDGVEPTEGGAVGPCRDKGPSPGPRDRTRAPRGQAAGTHTAAGGRRRGARGPRPHAQRAEAGGGAQSSTEPTGAGAAPVGAHGRRPGAPSCPALTGSAGPRLLRVGPAGSEEGKLASGTAVSPGRPGV